MSSFDAFVESLLETDLDLETKADTRVTYPCGQCAGTGVYSGARVHQEKSHCFACRGTGYFKASPEQRKHRRDLARANAANKVERGIAAIAEAHPAVFADLWAIQKTDAAGNAFLYALAGQLFRKGTLSDNQVNAWYRGKAKLEELKAARAAEEAQSQVAGVDLTPIRTIFDNAMANGHKKPAYRAEGLVLKAAAAHGRNPGALYVTSAETGDYLGKLVDTTFHPLRTDAAKAAGAALLVIAANPMEAAVRYGRKTGTCACCGRKLDNKLSVELGIGPICREKWGL